MSSSNLPEAWLRGPVPGVSPALQPVAHALIQAVEDAERLAGSLDTATLWRMPGNAASIGFHLRHMANALDRLFTYARGEQLSEAQREALAAEKTPTPDVDAATLLAGLRRAVERAMDQLRATRDADLDAARAVGRAALPSTVRGLLHHAAEHTARHAGPVSTTVKVLAGLDAADGG